MNESHEAIGFIKEKERKKALETLEKAKEMNRPTRKIPSGMSGEEFKKLIYKK